MHGPGDHDERAPRERRSALAGLEDLERRGVPDPRSRRDPGRARTIDARPAQPMHQPVMHQPVMHQPTAPSTPRSTVAAAPDPFTRRTQQRVRRIGPLAALVLPAAAGLASLLVLQGSTTSARGIGGFLLALVAAPLLPAFGEPMRAGSGAVLAAVAASAVLWFVVGTIAAYRATRGHDGGWTRFWGEYLWLCLCVWVGAALAVVAANLVLGRVLL